MLPNVLQCVKTPHTHYKQRIVKFQMPVVLRLRSISDGGETLSILDGHIFNTDALVLAKRLMHLSGPWKAYKVGKSKIFHSINLTYCPAAQETNYIGSI